MKGSLVWRLLRRNISGWQMAGYSLASLVGLTIVLTALQFYADVRSGMDDRNQNHDYLVISKKIGLLDRTTAFSGDEIRELESQPWVEAVGKFEASRFRAAVGVEFQGHTLSTETFFESVPEKFFDHVPEGWKFDPACGEVPIILSRDYLSLYNFGFASSRGLPRLRDNEVSMIPLSVAIAGRGEMTRLKGYIAGFSSRISTIAVPESFMKWATEKYGDTSDIRGPSRLVVEVSDPGNPAVTDYMRSHDIEIAGDRQDNSETGYLLKLITGIVMAIGIIITLLAFIILTLSIYLLVQKNRRKIDTLIMLGYRPGEIAGYYYRLITAANCIIMMCSIAISLCIRPVWTVQLKAMDMTGSDISVTIIAGLAITLTVTGMNLWIIRKRIIQNK